MKRVALCFRGSMSRIKAGHLLDNLYSDIPYVDFKPVKKSLDIHLFDKNKDCVFDIFIHCWNEDLKKPLVDLYNPVSYRFESQLPYKNQIKQNIWEMYGKTAQRLSIKKVVELFYNYSKENNIVYDKVILYRPDVLLYKDLYLDKYRDDTLYVNSDLWEDFHIIANHNITCELYNIFPMKTSIQNYVQNVIKRPMKADDIKCGIHQEIVRKIKSAGIDRHGIDRKIFLKYGFNLEYLNLLEHK